MEDKKGYYIRRLNLIRNHLKNDKLSEISILNDLDKWRQNVKFDKKILIDVYYPFHNDLRDLVHKIISENPEFK